jgi:hypothetical protein
MARQRRRERNNKSDKSKLSITTTTEESAGQLNGEIPKETNGAGSSNSNHTSKGKSNEESPKGVNQETNALNAREEIVEKSPRDDQSDDLETAKGAVVGEVSLPSTLKSTPTPRDDRGKVSSSENCPAEAEVEPVANSSPTTLSRSRLTPNGNDEKKVASRRKASTGTKVEPPSSDATARSVSSISTSSGRKASPAGELARPFSTSPVQIESPSRRIVGDSASVDVEAFFDVFLPLADKSSKKNRRAEWPNADTSGNGILSLSMVKRWVNQKLSSVYGQHRGTALFKKYGPIYLRAFHSARDVPDKQDYVSPSEFRLFIAYLCVYALAFDAFDVIKDGKEDHRMSRSEWFEGCRKVARHGFVALAEGAGEDVSYDSLGDMFDRVVDRLDDNGGGMVLILEWCDYLKESEIAAGTLMGSLITISPNYPPTPTSNCSVLEMKGEASKQPTEEDVAQTDEASKGQGNGNEAHTAVAGDLKINERSPEKLATESPTRSGKASKVQAEKMNAQKKSGERADKAEENADDASKENAKTGKANSQRNEKSPGKRAGKSEVKTDGASNGQSNEAHTGKIKGRKIGMGERNSVLGNEESDKVVEATVTSLSHTSETCATQIVDPNQLFVVADASAEIKGQSGEIVRAESDKVAVESPATKVSQEVDSSQRVTTEDPPPEMEEQSGELLKVESDMVATHAAVENSSTFSTETSTTSTSIKITNSTTSSTETTTMTTTSANSSKTAKTTAAPKQEVSLTVTTQTTGRFQVLHGASEAWKPSLPVVSTTKTTSSSPTSVAVWSANAPLGEQQVEERGHTETFLWNTLTGYGKHSKEDTASPSRAKTTNTAAPTNKDTTSPPETTRKTDEKKEKTEDPSHLHAVEGSSADMEEQSDVPVKVESDKIVEAPATEVSHVSGTCAKQDVDSQLNAIEDACAEKEERSGELVKGESDQLAVEDPATEVSHISWSSAQEDVDHSQLIAPVDVAVEMEQSGELVNGDSDEVDVESPATEVSHISWSSAAEYIDASQMFAGDGAFAEKEAQNGELFNGDCDKVAVETQASDFSRSNTAQDVDPSQLITFEGASTDVKRGIQRRLWSTAAQETVPSKLIAGEGASADVKAFLDIFLPLSYMTDESTSAREIEWMNADTNGEGALPLSMVERWIQRRLCSALNQKRGMVLYKMFFPAYTRAFRASRDVPADPSPDLVNRSEFRLLIACLCVYALAFDAFSMVDSPAWSRNGHRDQRLSLTEWLTGCRKVSNHGFIALANAVCPDATEESLSAIFNSMSEKGADTVQLTEWFKFLGDTELAANTLMGLIISIGSGSGDDYPPKNIPKEVVENSAGESNGKTSKEAKLQSNGKATGESTGTTNEAQNDASSENTPNEETDGKEAHEDEHDQLSALVDHAERAFVEGSFRRALQLANAAIKGSIGETEDANLSSNDDHVLLRLDIQGGNELFTIDDSNQQQSRDRGCFWLDSKKQKTPNPIDRMAAVALQSWYEISQQARNGKEDGKHHLEPFVNRYYSSTRQTPISANLLIILVRFFQATGHFAVAVQLVSQVLSYHKKHSRVATVKCDDEESLKELSEILWLHLLPYCTDAAKFEVARFHDEEDEAAGHELSSSRWVPWQEPQIEALDHLFNRMDPFRTFDKEPSLPGWLVESLHKCHAVWMSRLEELGLENQQYPSPNQPIRSSSSIIEHQEEPLRQRMQLRLREWMRRALALAKNVKESCLEREVDSSTRNRRQLVATAALVSMWLLARRYHLRRRLLRAAAALLRNAILKPAQEIVEALLPS